MRNAGLEETQAGIKIAGRNLNNLRYADDTTLMAESEDLKSLFNSSLLSIIRVVIPAYLSLLIFLPAIEIPACTSSSLAFCMIYSIYKIN